MLTGVALGFNDTWCTPQDILADERERNGWFEVSQTESLIIFVQFITLHKYATGYLVIQQRKKF